MNKLKLNELNTILEESKYTVVHIDTDWDNYRFQINEKITKAKKEYGEKVSFGYIDCDIEQEYAKDIGLQNTPSLAYYSGTILKAVVIGVEQDIIGNIKRLMQNVAIDCSNTISRK